MVRRAGLVIATAVVALTLVSAPVTMGDWGEQGTLSADPVDESELREETPILHYQNLSPTAKTAVRRAIDAPGGTHTIYGSEDRPDRFYYYSEGTTPGAGVYAIVYEGAYYRLTTYATGGFPFVYWLYELPFVAYGVGLGVVAYRTSRGRLSTRGAALAVAPGIAFHLLGPEFDFPVLAPPQFIALGIFATATLVAGLVWDRSAGRATADGE